MVDFEEPFGPQSGRHEDGTPVAPSGREVEDTFGGVDESKEDLLGEELSSGNQEADDPITTEPTRRRGAADKYGDTNLTFVVMVKRLHPGDDIDDIFEYYGITKMEGAYEWIETNWDAYWRQVVVEDVLGLQLSRDTQSQSPVAMLIETYPDLTMIDVVMMTKEEWLEDFAVKISPFHYRKLQAFHHWMANPSGDEKEETMELRLTRLTAHSFRR